MKSAIEILLENKAQLERHVNHLDERIAYLKQDTEESISSRDQAIATLQDIETALDKLSNGTVETE